MLKTEVIFFLLSLLSGILSGIFCLFLSPLNKKNRAAAITLQFILAGISVFSLTLITFFVNNGAYTLYSIIGAILGFCSPLLVDKKRKK